MIRHCAPRLAITPFGKKDLTFKITVGSRIGQTGGDFAQTLDFGAADTRITPLPYISPGKLNNPSLDVYDVCPLDYFDATIKTTLSAKLGAYGGSVRPIADPVCGSIAQDIAGSVQGKWFKPGSPTTPEDPHLTLGHDNVTPAKGAFSVGNSLTGAQPYEHMFTTTSSGLVNRDFGQVTADGKIYCYEAFMFPNNIGVPNTIFILQLTSSTKLRIEKQTAASCGSGPWSFTTNQVDYER